MENAMTNRQFLFCLTLFLCCHFGTEGTVTLSPTEIRVCNQESKVVFTCWTSDAFLTWHVGNFLYQFPNAVTGNAPKMLGQFRLEVINSSSGVIMSTATAENATALGPSIAAVSCFGSVDDPNVTKSGYILARDPPSSPDLVNISVNSDSNVTVSWSSLSSNVCLDHINVNISMCSSDTIIFSLKADSNATTISHPLPDNISGVCTTITPVDDRGRTPSEINKSCSCTSTVLTSPTPTSTRHHEEINISAAVVSSTIVAVVLFTGITILIGVSFIIWRIHKKELHTDTHELRERTASQLQDAVENLNRSLPVGEKQFEDELDNVITIAQDTKSKMAKMRTGTL